MDFDNFHIAKIGKHTFILEECRDFPKGLSEREDLLENEGNCNPCELNECEKFEHDSADTVVELKGGTCKKNMINEGLIYRLM